MFMILIVFPSYEPESYSLSKLVDDDSPVEEILPLKKTSSKKDFYKKESGEHRNIPLTMEEKCIVQIMGSQI